ncbi:class I SAM-dependent methyltransferase, partial [Arthrospira platensis SPKY1]|nr:class I SAM-dependent methyltransferase [Arthrospira platensis SPKY1]
NGGVGVYSNYDWKRLFIAYQLVQGKSVLDVGIGNGAFSNILTKSERFDKVVGIDIKKNSKLIIPEENYSFYEMSVVDLKFSDNQFDTVVAMEVLEHLEVQDFPVALKELRRVTKNRLITTVPYNEPEPVWWHDKPGGHRQSFNDHKLQKFFPHAVGTIVDRGGINWIMMVEDFFKLESFTIISNQDFINRFAKRN